MQVDAQVLKRFVHIAADELSGDWVVLGGSVLLLLGAGRRVTLDIDVAGPPGSRQEQTLKLMRIAEGLGLPVEAINQAAAYFLHRIEGWQERLVLVHEGSTARIHRPDVTLFVLLKAGRMTESDLADCIRFIEWSGEHGDEPDVPVLVRAIDEALTDCESSGRRERLARLRETLMART
jgi:hypothetical protein